MENIYPKLLWYPSAKFTNSFCKNTIPWWILSTIPPVHFRLVFRVIYSNNHNGFGLLRPCYLTRLQTCFIFTCAYSFTSPLHEGGKGKGRRLFQIFNPSKTNEISSKLFCFTEQCRRYVQSIQFSHFCRFLSTQRELQ